MNTKENLEQIKLQIRRSIEDKLIGDTHEIQGIQRRFLKIVKWWKDGVEFPEYFDLLNVIKKRKTEINVFFNLWALVEIDENTKRQANLGGNFNDIIVKWDNKTFEIDTSNASFFNLQMS